jgi:hypothetical protein
MRRKWLRLAGDMLEMASEKFGNHGCNDWDFPDDWTAEDRQGLASAMHEANGDPENYEPDNIHLPDWWVMAFLADRLKAEAGIGKDGER